MAHPNNDLPSIARRLAAGRMLHDGVPLAQVAQAMGMKNATVEKYQHLLEKGGLDALRDVGVGGRPSSLDAEARAWLAEALRGSPREYGFDSDNWTNLRLRELITRRFGVSYSRVYAWRLATDLGVSYRFGRSA
ncbi:helix-turn-helix domain-containing protein [Paraburkholderia bryophila]|uniref:Transposase n=1 Tax=Paraburkholderia bryophila TaxID=420952 RepID=A0A329CN71_9BURK|nr:helix-turn-helix domain-containing protein [Paraburkholderia bryophila]RAS33204.1 transposase [Paraburkholderia bryophila]